jgi:Putative protein-S-isoprenylcysteine methyltransferase
MQSPYDYLFIITVLAAFVVIDYPRSILVPLARQRGRVMRRSDRMSSWPILVCDNVSWIISSGILVLGIGKMPQFFIYIGIGFVIFGFALRQWAISALGLFFAPTVRIIRRHKLILHGPYAYLRHPSYTGALMLLFGIAIASQSLEAIVIATILLIPAYMYRIHVEERALRLRFGKHYDAYRKRTWALVPYLF